MGETSWRNIDVSVDVLEKIHKLQFEVFTYMNNNIRGQKQSTQRSGAPTKSITDRLKGKDGRIRGNLMGKRVDFSARSVITPDATMDVDQVGVPYKVAMVLTLPVRVTNTNISMLTRRVVKGAHDIMGAESVITTNGVMIQLAYCENREKIRLQFGWIVERFLADDDIVIFNRQPSLHKVGMMGHRVKLMDGNTFRMNLCCANPYNADFDGDEMNLHVPQSPTAIADVATLMMVPRQIISPQANRPVMGIVQDTLLGAHLLTDADIFLDRMMACHLIACLKYSKHRLCTPCIKKPVELWSGKQLISLLLPPTLNMGKFIPDDTETHRVLVRRGILLTGRLSKATLGTSAGGFVDVLFRQFGSTVTIRWMSDIQRIVNAWLCMQGFSVGIDDCMLPPTGETRVRERIETAMKFAGELLKEQKAEGIREQQVLESTVVRILSKVLMQTGGIVDEELGASNSIRKMVTAGSKGNPINLSQICGCVGQQSVEGRRIFAEKGGRTLAYFKQNDTSLTGQGFVENSYVLGLHPHEYFFHAMGGREGLVDTAVKTATTGYIQRRQMKSMEDHKVYYDGTIRNAEETIIDFSYGGDGMDPCLVERIKLVFLETPEYELRTMLTIWEFQCAQHYKDSVMMCKTSLSIPFDARVLLPYNPNRIPIEHKDNNPTATEDEIKIVIDDYLLSEESSVYCLAALEFFNTKQLQSENLSMPEIVALFKNIETCIFRARVSPGEMVGSIAAQSIGEPCTQMTLNTFHFAGVSSKNVTLGIPRLKELLDQTKLIKTPSNCIHLIPALATNKDFADYFAATLPVTCLGDIVLSCNIIYDPDFYATTTENDNFMVHLANTLHGICPSHSSRFVVRLVLNQDIMKTRYLTPPLIRKLLQNRLRNRAYVISSETNSVEWIVRIRFMEVQTMLEKLAPHQRREREGLLCHRVMSALLDTITIGGHIKVASAHVRKIDTINHDTSPEYVIDTHGCTLIDLSAAPCIDWYSTTSNDIHEIHNTLGLEAAVNVLYAELFNTISFDGTYVDCRHIMMLVNTMTRGGYIMPLSRHGINRMGTGPLLRCSFEETPDILCDAACFGELDSGKGVSQNIMTGQLASVGTGVIDVLINPSLMHPRDIMTTIPIQKRILKSTVRVRTESRPDLDFVVCDIRCMPPINQTCVVEMPFNNETISHKFGEQIFTPNDVQTPYNDIPMQESCDTMNHTPEVDVDYCPSSPMEDAF